MHLSMASASILEIAHVENRSTKLVKKTECSFAEIKKRGELQELKTKKFPQHNLGFEKNARTIILVLRKMPTPWY